MTVEVEVVEMMILAFHSVSLCSLETRLLEKEDENGQKCRCLGVG